MSPSRSKAISLPSRLTSTFIQVPLSTAMRISWVAMPGGALTFHFGGLAASAGFAGAGPVCAQAWPAIHTKASAVAATRTFIAHSVKLTRAA